jgi:hypothetical protein
MLLPPAEVLASWPAPNYINPETRGPALIIISSILLAVATVSVSLRVLEKLTVFKSFGIDDILILLALLPSIASLVCVGIVTYQYDYERHSWDIPLQNILSGRKFIFAIQILFTVSTILIKLSILFYIRRLFANSGASISYVINASICISGLMFVAFIFSFLFQCRYVAL